MSDFEVASNVLSEEGLDVSFVQIATGEGLQAFNIDEYALKLNGSWPLLLDDSTVGTSLPSGATDALVVVDSAGFIADWSPDQWHPRKSRKHRKRLNRIGKFPNANIIDDDWNITTANIGIEHAK